MTRRTAPQRRPRSVARPARRRPTLPAHDPRAIRRALRRQVYESGDSLSDLDDVVFRVDFAPRIWLPATLPHITADVNGYGRMGLDFPVAAQFYPVSTIRDVEGQRVIGLHRTGDNGFENGRAMTISAIGRYVRWEGLPRPFVKGLTFDRATYRERLEAALVEARAGETPEARAVRNVIQRAPWGGAEEMGLTLVNTDVTLDGLTLTFRDEFWQTVVRFRVPWNPEDLAASVRSAVREIAQWNHGGWVVSWFPLKPRTEVSPPYPVEWHRDYYP